MLLQILWQTLRHHLKIYIFKHVFDLLAPTFIHNNLFNY